MRRERDSGFVVFALAFWTAVAILIGLLSFLVPSYRKLGCISRLFVGFGGVFGLFVGGLAFGQMIPEAVQDWQQWSLIATMFVGAVAGASGTARFASWLLSEL